MGAALVFRISSGNLHSAFAGERRHLARARLASCSSVLACPNHMGGRRPAHSMNCRRQVLIFRLNGCERDWPSRHHGTSMWGGRLSNFTGSPTVMGHNCAHRNELRRAMALGQWRNAAAASNVAGSAENSRSNATRWRHHSGGNPAGIGQERNAKGTAPLGIGTRQRGAVGTQRFT